MNIRPVAAMEEVVEMAEVVEMVKEQVERPEAKKARVSF